MNATTIVASRTGIVAALVLGLVGMTPAFGQEQPGRYTMSPVEGGFARLDTHTGAMSLCKAQPRDPAGNAAWSCLPIGDGAVEAQAKASKLETENKELRAEVKRMEDQLGLNGPAPTPPVKPGELPTEPRPGGKSAGPLNLPSEEEVDKALSYVERMVKKFHDTMKRIESNERKGMPL